MRLTFALLLTFVLATPLQAQVTITPASGATGGGTVTSSQLKLQDGSQTVPSLAFASSGNDNTGIFLLAADAIGFSSNGTARMYVDGGNTVLHSGGGLAWGSTGLSSPDVVLSRGAANRLDLASGDSLNLVSGSVTATSFIGSGASLTGITGATGGVSNLVNTNLVADSDNNGSGVIDLMTGVTSKWQVANAGHFTAMATTVQLLAADGTAALPALSFASTNNNDNGLFYSSAIDGVVIAQGSTGIVGVNANAAFGVQLRNSSPVSWSSGEVGATGDLFLFRQGANHLMQRNGTNAQKVEILNSYTNGASYESFAVDWQTMSGVALIGTRSAATGFSRSAAFVSQNQNAAASYAGIVANRAQAVLKIGYFTSIDTSGVTTNDNTGSLTPIHLGVLTHVGTSGNAAIVSITPTYNQSASTASNTDLLINRTETAVGSGTQRFIQAQAGGITQFQVLTNGAVITAADGQFTWATRNAITSPADGVLRFTNAAFTDFSRLQFGGTTSAFPALKRSTTTLETRLADDSAYAGLQTLHQRFGTGSPEGVVTAPVGATYHRTDGGAGTSFYVKESGAGNTGWVAK